MNEAIKARWVAALRSGCYRQAAGKLHNSSDQYCCLGVLCDVVKDELNGRWNGAIFEAQGDENSTYLPESVANHAEIHPEAESDLVNLNDSGQTFYVIADYIEKQL